ncbi:MAG: malonyl-[acyl-carrier protein] O-methyltransferase BioC [Nitrosomonadales bacterium]|nr:malonyl-[acyl-carrier protein] O-methyltransferase BioC [Nitrosomonadales bacterium]|tara:strand:+ start:2973 stop:3794 length:822 start_codon:yes stop_codon:yes gene_type:complete
MIDKNYKRKIFNRSAKSYDEFSILQNDVSDNLFDRLVDLKLNPKLILDLGCGTGRNGKILKNIYKDAKIVNYDFSENMLTQARMKQISFFDKILQNKRSSFICGDIENLVFTNKIFDIVWSTNSLQWCNNLSVTFKSIGSILKPNGLFIFTTFGPKTLYELRNITRKISSFQKTNDFIDMDNIKKILINKGFSNPILESEEVCLTYSNIKKLFLELKSIGATSGLKIKKNGLTGKSFLKKIEEGYENYKHKEKFTATYEVIYGYARYKKNNKT